jgi:PIN domain nuclease of toxin-antitoxin system
MRYLFDTHTYFWFRTAPKQLPASVLDLLTDPANQIFLSVATPWEMAIKTGIGKLDAAPLLEDFELRETAAGFTLLGITAGHAIRSGLLPHHHRDPFDRLLAAQALELDLPILSRDLIFDRYGLRRLWA